MASCKVKERNEGGGMRLRNCYLRSDPVASVNSIDSSRKGLILIVILIVISCPIEDYDSD